MAKKAVKPKERNPVGRPREHDRAKVALDMVEWAKKPDSLNLNKFTAYYEPQLTPAMILLWKDECAQFRESYARVKSFLAFRREEWLNNERLHQSAYNHNTTTYDAFMSGDREDKVKFDAAQKANDQKPVDEEAARLAALMIEQMRAMQENKG